MANTFTKKQLKALKEMGITDPVARLFSLIDFEDTVQGHHPDVYEEVWDFIEYESDDEDED